MNRLYALLLAIGVVFAVLTAYIFPMVHIGFNILFIVVECAFLSGLYARHKYRFRQGGKVATIGIIILGAVFLGLLGLALLGESCGCGT